MKVNPEKLENELYRYFDRFCRDRVLTQKIKDEFGKRGISPAETQRILDTKILLKGVHPDIQCLLCKLFYEETNEEVIKPENYFNDSEIERAKSFKIETEEQERYPIVFENVEKVHDDLYSFYLDAQQIADLYSKNLITWNKETQRQTKIKNISGDFIEVPDINTISVNQIADRIVKGKQKTNHINFNLLKNGEENYEYDAKNRRFIMYSGELDIADGAHRSYGVVAAVRINPDVQFKLGVYFTNYTVEEAREFIKQENIRNKIEKSHLETFDSENLSMTVALDLNTQPKCDFNGKITTNKTNIDLGIALTTTDIMDNVIKYEYDDVLKSNRDVRLITEWLVKFFNELMGLYADEFITNIKQSKENTYINHENMFIGYIALSKELYGKENWKDILQKVMEKIDFSKGNSIWNEDNLNINSKKNLSKPYIKKLSNYFKSIINNERVI
jgi:hypothetical protein